MPAAGPRECAQGPHAEGHGQCQSGGYGALGLGPAERASTCQVCREARLALRPGRQCKHWGLLPGASHSLSRQRRCCFQFPGPVLPHPPTASFTVTSKRFPVNVNSMHADYITTETHQGPKADCHFRNIDLVSPRTWPGVYPN